MCVVLQYLAFLTLGLNQDLYKIEMEILSQSLITTHLLIMGCVLSKKGHTFDLLCHLSCLKVCFREELQRIPLILTVKRIL